MSNMLKLLTIQRKLSCPKSRKNSFGNYYYRSAEDILDAAKPLLAETRTVLIIQDNPVDVGGWLFIHARVDLCDAETGDIIATGDGYARHEAEKKGMDASQITGSTSSYARKYALAGLFSIDDGNDSDAIIEHKPEKPEVDLKAMDTEKGRAYIRSFNGAQAAIKEIGKSKHITKAAEEFVKSVFEEDK